MYTKSRFLCYRLPSFLRGTERHETRHGPQLARGFDSSSAVHVIKRTKNISALLVSSDAVGSDESSLFHDSETTLNDVRR
jgi:hypothetical protein